MCGVIWGIRESSKLAQLLPGATRMNLRERIDEQDATFVAAFVAAVVVGIVVGTVATLLLFTPDSRNTSGTGQARQSGQHLGLPSSASSRESDRMRRCRDAATAMKPALVSAASSVDQWEVHVGAMNKLVVGAISLQQATAFWNQTRVGASRRIAAFDRDWTRVKQTGLDCPAPAQLPAEAPQELRSCAREVAADLRVLSTARSAIGTWTHHVHAMNMLRMGRMSPATATQMWLGMWRRGQQQIGTYRAAVRAAQREPACAAALSSATASPGS